MDDKTINAVTKALIDEASCVTGTWRAMTFCNGGYEIKSYSNKTEADNAVEDSRNRMRDSLIKKYGYRG